LPSAYLQLNIRNAMNIIILNLITELLVDYRSSYIIVVRETVCYSEHLVIQAYILPYRAVIIFMDIFMKRDAPEFTNLASSARMFKLSLMFAGDLKKCKLHDLFVNSLCPVDSVFSSQISNWPTVFSPTSRRRKLAARRLIDIIGVLSSTNNSAMHAG